MKALVVGRHPEKNLKKSVINKIKSPENNLKLKYIWRNSLTKKHFKNIDLIISIGGDGTALSASHYNEDRPVLLVNDSPQKSIGALTTLNLSQLKNKLRKISQGKYITEKLERIDVKINNKKIRPCALNDVFIGNKKPYLMSKYTITHNNKTEEQRSSGIIFSTGTGSTAWFKSAGGRPFSPCKKIIKMLVREPYFNKIQKFGISRATIKNKKTIKVKSLSYTILAIDSIREIPLKKNDEIKIKTSSHPLLRIK